jgi:protein-S-isoprenylcysteine O-methyltransferase Ste14
VPNSGEERIRIAIYGFAILAFAISAGRSLWFWGTHKKRPVARPRNRAEQLWGAAFALAVAAMVAVGAARIAGPRAYDLTIPLRALESDATFVISIILIAGGFGLALVAQSQMGASWRIGIPRESTALITRGVYKWIRNPIYTGLVIATIGYFLLLPSVATLAIALISTLVVRAWAAAEEHRQLELHGEEYQQYCARTGRFLPRLFAR